MARYTYRITIVSRTARWRTATEANLVKMAGVPPRIAAEWAQIRREMSPAGLRKKLRAQVN